MKAKIVIVIKNWYNKNKDAKPTGGSGSGGHTDAQEAGAVAPKASKASPKAMVAKAGKGKGGASGKAAAVNPSKRIGGRASHPSIAKDRAAAAYPVAGPSSAPPASAAVGGLPASPPSTAADSPMGSLAFKRRIPLATSPPLAKSARLTDGRGGPQDCRRIVEGDAAGSQLPWEQETSERRRNNENEEEGEERGQTPSTQPPVDRATGQANASARLAVAGMKRMLYAAARGTVGRGIAIEGGRAARADATAGASTAGTSSARSFQFQHVGVQTEEPAVEGTATEAPGPAEGGAAGEDSAVSLLRTRVQALEAQCIALQTENDTLQAENDTLVADRDAFQAKVWEEVNNRMEVKDVAVIHSNLISHTYSPILPFEHCTVCALASLLICITVCRIWHWSAIWCAIVPGCRQGLSRVSPAEARWQETGDQRLKQRETGDQ